jgi:hypothetical protein
MLIAALLNNDCDWGESWWLAIDIYNFLIRCYKKGKVQKEKNRLYCIWSNIYCILQKLGYRSAPKDGEPKRAVEIGKKEKERKKIMNYIILK